MVRMILLMMNLIKRNESTIVNVFDKIFLEIYFLIKGKYLNLNLEYNTQYTYLCYHLDLIQSNK